jgi:hypothetical protein
MVLPGLNCRQALHDAGEAIKFVHQSLRVSHGFAFFNDCSRHKSAGLLRIGKDTELRVNRTLVLLNKPAKV